MSKILTDNQYYYQIADAIREQNGTNNTYTPPQMVRALKDLFYEEVEGVPPISFNGIGENLLDYRIDGASGEVGDRTSNLFKNVWFQGEINSSTGIMQNSSIFVCSDFIPITPLITYSCSRTVSREYNNLRCYDANKQYVGTGATNANIGNPLNNGVSFGTFMITNESVAYIRFNDKSNDLTTKYMLVEGEYTASTMPDYKPYGYKVPVGERTKNLLDFENPTIKAFNFEKISNGIYQANTNKVFLANRWALDTEAGVQYRILGTTNNSEITIQLSNFINGTSTPQGGEIRTNESINLTFTATGKTTLSIFSRLANQSFTATNFQIYKSSIADTSYEPYGYKVPVVVSGKNLLSKLPDSRIDKGIEYTNVNNLYLHIEGTSNAVYSQTTQISLLFKKGKYYINFYCDEQYKSKLFVLLRNNNNTDIVNVYSSGASFELNNDETIKLIAGVKENNTTINTNMYIQIVSGITSQSTYEPYHEPTTTNIYLDNPIRTVEDEVEYIDYSEQKQHRVRKNLLQNTATTQTINGVTFTVNNDKSITCNGTATGTTAVTINTIFSINSTKISGCPMGGSWSSFELDLLNINTNNVDAIDTGNGAVIQNENLYRVRIRIASGYTCNNLTFYPMIRKADIEDDTYEPYIENTEVDVTLPAIPTLDGTNILSVDTTVQPSNVYVKARKESQYETIMREDYEEQLSDIESALEEV